MCEGILADAPRFQEGLLGPHPDSEEGFRGYAPVLGGESWGDAPDSGTGSWGQALVLGGGAGWDVHLWNDHCVGAVEPTGFCRRQQMLGQGASRNGALGDVSWECAWCMVVTGGLHVWPQL